MAAHVYSDDAVVIAGSTQIPVQAKLRKPYTQPSEKWFGTLAPDNPQADLYILLENSDRLALRFPDGSEATFTADWTAVNGVTGSIRIDGTGPAPF
ncbi:hypothetical protein [Streptomyces sp. NPDC101165]|uniref:hypothetical protein n=1 Tax=Streptomyces sp. NPDC101165 TaxID=3366119 RepID=UPI00380BD175